MNATIMNQTRMAIALALVFAAAPAFAQSTSKVTTQNINQTQAGLLTRICVVSPDAQWPMLGSRSLSIHQKRPPPVAQSLVGLK